MIQVYKTSGGVWGYLILVEVDITKFALLQAVHQIHLLIRQTEISASHLVMDSAPGKETEKQKSRVDSNIKCKLCSFHVIWQKYHTAILGDVILITLYIVIQSFCSSFASKVFQEEKEGKIKQR